MKRFITNQLLAWKNQEGRKPLIIRGARQVGKTWSVVEFGKTHFDGHVHVIDLEQHPDWHRVFEPNLSTTRILSELEILINARFHPETDLLFLDEIQSCPRAIMALRYFYEECPEMHVIAAGSLLEFAMQDISFPVGRLQFLNMAPMSFAEYLMAVGKDIAAESILAGPSNLSASVHQLLLEEVRRYMFIGGMPECILAYLRNQRLRDAFEVQSDLVHSFRQDFSKYAPHADKRCLNAVFSAVAGRVGCQIKYAHLAEDYTNPTIKKAFDLLCQARVIRKIPACSSPQLPLGASASERKFKALMLDIGLMQHLSGMPVDVEYARTDLLAIHQGAMAEQFVGQELVAAGQNELVYWSRDARSSKAEVDFLMVVRGKVYPVEVKSGSSGRLKSLHLFLQSYPESPAGTVFSCAPASELPDQRLSFLPLYYTYCMGR
ncbi:MAG: ATP-binding protein [Desulfatirhabdiaceae bacterium]